MSLDSLNSYNENNVSVAWLSPKTNIIIGWVRGWLYDSGLLRDFSPEQVDKIMNDKVRILEEKLALLNQELGIECSEEDDDLIDLALIMLSMWKTMWEIQEFFENEKI